MYAILESKTYKSNLIGITDNEEVALIMAIGESLYCEIVDTTKYDLFEKLEERVTNLEYKQPKEDYKSITLNELVEVLEYVCINGRFYHYRTRRLASQNINRAKYDSKECVLTTYLPITSNGLSMQGVTLINEKLANYKTLNLSQEDLETVILELARHSFDSSIEIG